MINSNLKIGIIGLGYVGLPLFLCSSKFFPTKGFDINRKRISELKNNYDFSEEYSKSVLKKLNFSNKISSKFNFLSDCNFYIITVPTPVKRKNIPDISFLESACTLLSKFIKKNDIVVFESTVYPGLTRHLCINIIQKKSSLEFNKDFFAGYSPERINTGKNSLKINEIIKITSGSNKKTSIIIDSFYSKIIDAGTYMAKSIEIAESAKVIENIQRDVNIALMNELKIFFDKKNIDFNQVLNAANTKWNFIDFKPGLVGGHCIGVDPYYLIFDSEKINVDLNLIKNSRKKNQDFIFYLLTKLKSQIKSFKLSKPDILVIGCTFKPDVKDFRNSSNLTLVNLISKKTNSNLFLYEPFIFKSILKELDKKINFYNPKSLIKFDIIIPLVVHKNMNGFMKNCKNLLKSDGKILYLI